jgi:hypothetical protein
MSAFSVENIKLIQRKRQLVAALKVKSEMFKSISFLNDCLIHKWTFCDIISEERINKLKIITEEYDTNRS